jgi:EAL domain-containing protein (putative c-di-GMP-specific phosphodiesterase class I)/PAS domain-containing protein
MQTLSLLMHCDSPNAAESLASLVRPLGYAVDVQHCDDSHAFSARLADASSDLALYVVSAEDTLPAQAQDPRQTPLIALLTSTDAALGSFIGQGADHVAYLDDQDHVRHVILHTLQTQAREQRLQTVEARIHAAQQPLMVLLQSTRQAVAYVHDGFHVYANPAYLRRLGYASLEALQSTPLLDVIPDDKDRTAITDALRQLTAGDADRHQLTLSLITPDEELTRYHAQLQRSVFDNEDAVQMILDEQVIESVSPQALPRAPRQKIHDPVTQVFSQSHMLTLLDTVLEHARTSGDEYLAFLVHLETGPDKPEYTDQCMRAAADRLLATIDTNDVLGRYSGNSFLLLSSRDASREPAQLADQLRRCIGNLGGLLHGDTHCRVSAVVVDRHCDDAEHALTRLKSSFVHAQDAKVPVHVDLTQFLNVPGSQMVDHVWAGRVSTLLNNNRLTLAGLPVVRLRNDSWSRYSLVLQLHDEQNAPLPLSAFSDPVRMTGLSASVDRWIIFHTARQLSQVLQHQPHVQVFIPLLGNVLQQHDFYTWLEKVVQQFHLPANSLILQLDADAALDAPETFGTFCRHMASLNCGICVTEHDDPTVTHELFDQSRNTITYLAPSQYLVDDIHSDRDSYDTLNILAEQCRRQQTLSLVSGTIDASTIAALWKIGIDLVAHDALIEAKNTELTLDLSATLSA